MEDLAGTCGQLLTAWGSQGSGNGRFNGPHRVAARVIEGSDDHVFVADAGNDRIQMFQVVAGACPEGTAEVGSGAGERVCFVNSVGDSGVGSGQFVAPHDVAVDVATGAVYVADTDSDRIQVFDAETLAPLDS